MGLQFDRITARQTSGVGEGRKEDQCRWEKGNEDVLLKKLPLLHLCSHQFVSPPLPSPETTSLLCCLTADDTLFLNMFTEIC